MPENATRQQARELLPDIIAWRRTLHACPEVQMDTPVTAGHIERFLRGIGITEIRTGVGGNGIVAVLRGEKPGKVLGIRADCDGLPTPEETGLPFAATNGNSHSCGHDAHCAMALGAAKILFERRAELAGSVKCIFQPYEEGARGAQMMIEDGALENPALDAVIGLHTGSLCPELNPGEIGYRSGVMNANSDRIYATFHGKGGHGAAPHRTVDAVVMAAHAIVQMQTIVSRNLDPFDSGVVSVGTVRSLASFNVIADRCDLEGTVRSFSPEVREVLHRRIRAICESVATGFGGSVDLAITPTAKSMFNDPELTEILKKTSEAIVGKDMTRHIDLPGTWGEDMYRYFDHAPGVFFLHTSVFADAAKNFPHHHPKFTVNEDTLWSGSAILAEFALTWQQ